MESRNFYFSISVISLLMILSYSHEMKGQYLVEKTPANNLIVKDNEVAGFTPELTQKSNRFNYLSFNQYSMNKQKWPLVASDVYTNKFLFTEMGTTLQTNIIQLPREAFKIKKEIFTAPNFQCGFTIKM